MAGKKENRLKKILIVILVVIILGTVISLTSGEDANISSSSNSQNTTQKESKSTSTTAKIGEPVRDGKFEFVVKSIECGRANVGADFLTETAQGQFCLLNVTVKNIGNEAQSLFSSNQYLYNADGQRYSADDSATFTVSPSSSSSWYNDINPGNSVEGAIVFDIPKDQVPVSAELHDSAFSGGVKVNLQ